MGYFEQIRRVLGQASGMARVPMPHLGERPGEQTGTNFERKYMAQGRPIYSMAVLKYR